MEQVFIKIEPVEVEIKQEHLNPDEIECRIKPEIDYEDNANNLASTKSNVEENNTKVVERSIKTEFNYESVNNVVPTNVNVGENDKRVSLLENKHASSEANVGGSTFTSVLLKSQEDLTIAPDLPPIQILNEFPPLDTQGPSTSIEVIGKVYENGKINRLNCVHCDKTFKNRANLKNHIKYVHAEDQSVECTECFRTFKSMIYLRSHVSSVHAKTEEVQCEHCQKVFMNKKKLNNHIYYTHRQPEEQVSCKICSKTYKSHYNLKIHMRYVHPEGDPHPCPLCYKTFKVEMLLQRHMKWAHPDEGMVYKCQECNKILPSIDSYKTHMKNVHLFNRATCDICKRTFKNKHSLERHMKNIHKGEENKEATAAEQSVEPYTPGGFTCQFCERTLHNTTSLFWHIERFHAQTQNLQTNFCIICKKDFSDYAALHRHLTTVHSLETATCKICHKEFKSPNNLQNHIRITHAPPEATQTCEACQKTFKCALHLRMHILAVHAEGEFPCDICQKTFASTKYLNKHKKSHSESRDYQCDICLKMYKNVNAVNKHKKQVHNGIKCNICNIKQINIDDHMRKSHPESMEIDEVTCSKCFKNLSSFEYEEHYQNCEGHAVQSAQSIQVKIEVEDMNDDGIDSVPD